MIYIYVLAKRENRVMENNRLKDKPPLYVETYNKILKNILDGLYNQENKLPNEIKLAKQMGVSRVTLRQALQLLQEDGVIESRKGVGNFLRNQKKYLTAGLEEIGNILPKCGISKIDKITCIPCLRQSTVYTDNIFERQIPVFLTATLLYYSDKECIAKCFSTLPTDLDFVPEIDMMNSEQVSKLIRKDIYKYAKVGKVEINMIKSIESEMKNEKCVYVVLTEKLIDDKGIVICLNKYYMPMERVNIQLKSM